MPKKQIAPAANRATKLRTKKKIAGTATRSRATKGKRTPTRTGSARGTLVSNQKKKRVTTKAASGEKFVKIQLRTKHGPPIDFESSPELQRAAMQWSYVLRNRRRWNTSDLTRDEQSARAHEQLQSIGLTKEQLRHLAGSEIVEVSIPFTTEKEGWEARIFPWEYMLSAATRSFRDGRPLIVIRHLDRQGRPARAPRKKFSRALIIESAPGELRSRQFDSERNLVTTRLAIKPTDLSIDGLAPRCDTKSKPSPDGIHVSGFDNNQAAALDVIESRRFGR